MNRIRKAINIDLSNIDKSIVLIPLYYALFLVLVFNFYWNIDITSFNRVFGGATIVNYDVAKVIKNFYLLFFFLVPLLIFFITVFACKIYKSCENFEKRSIIRFMNNMVLISVITLLFACIRKFETPLVMDVLIKIEFVFISVTILYLFFYNNEFNYFKFKWCFFISFASPLLIVPILGKYSVFLFAFFFPTLLLSLKSRIFESCWIKIFNASIPITFFYSIWSLYSELTVVLNQNNIYIKNHLFIYIVLLVLLVTLILWFSKIKEINEKLFLIGILISIIFAFVQPAISVKVGTDFFERANTSVSISDLFLFGELPIIETHGAHLLSDYLFGIIYKVINRDIIGSYFGLYNSYEFVIILLSLYYILTSFFEIEYVVMFLLFFPFYINTTFTFLTPCLISICALVFLLKNNQKSYHYIIYWILLAFSVLYKGDYGLAIGVACIITAVIVMLCKNQKTDLKKYIMTFFCVLGILLLAFCVICLFKQINPFSRIYEFISVMGTSTQNWSYNVIGDNTKLSISFTYIILPLISVISVLYLIYKVWKSEDNQNVIRLAITLSLFLSYIVNFSRTLQRHSLIETSIAYVAFTIMLAIPLLLTLIVKSNEAVFMVSYVALTFVCSALMSTENFELKSLFEKCENNFVTIEKLSVLKSERIERVQFDEKIYAHSNPVIEKLNLLLNEDETFIDYTNQSFMYSLSERNNPVYVNQSPGLLSGEYTQKKFIEEVNNSDDPVAMLPISSNLPYSISIDGLMNSYRYYKVSEYLYENFLPIDSVGDYAFWYRKKDIDILSRLNLEYKRVDIRNLDEKIISKDIAYYDRDSDSIIISATDKCNTFKFNTKEYKDKIIRFNFIATSDFEMALKDNEKIISNISIKAGNNEIILDPLMFINGVAILELKKDNRIYINDFEVSNRPLGYEYGTLEDLHYYKLGSLPYIWAKYDKQNAKDNEVLENLNLCNGAFNISEKNINKSQGNYVVLNVMLNEEKTISLDMKSGEDIKAVFEFDGIKGENSYIIRVSSDFYWYSNIVDNFKVNGLADCDVLSIQLLKGD